MKEILFGAATAVVMLLLRWFIIGEVLERLRSIESRLASIERRLKS